MDAIQMIKGSVGITSGSTFSFNDFCNMCKGYNIKLDVETVLRPIFNMFE